MPRLAGARGSAARAVLAGALIVALPGIVTIAAIPATSHAEELLRVNVGDGATEPYLLAVPAAGAQAVAILFPGGAGKFDLASAAGKLTQARGNFLIRSRGYFVDRGVATAVLDAPSDHPGGMPDDFRLGARHAADVAAIVADVKTRVSGVPVFLVGTSRGSVSAASVSARIGDAVAGVVLTSSMYRATHPRSREPGLGLSRFDFASIKIPVLLVHHRDDACASTPYTDARSLAKRFPLVTVMGGRPAESDPCQAMSAHGYLGKEVETVDAIAAWMLGKPYPTEVE